MDLQLSLPEIQGNGRMDAKKIPSRLTPFLSFIRSAIKDL